VNVLEDPTGLAELQKLGLRTVPVLARGKEYIFGQNTQQIIDFLGLKEDGGPKLSVQELHDRLDKFMGAAIELIPLMPADRLAKHVPGRPRSYRTLSFHLFRVVDAFLGASEGTTLVKEMFAEEPAADADTASLVAYGTKIRKRFGYWWARGDLAQSKRLETYYGPQTLHELLERTTWHCGQHVRQYMMLLEKEGIGFRPPLVDADFAKLPMPQNVWDG
jgi:hypothetical protein